MNEIKFIINGKRKDDLKLQEAIENIQKKREIKLDIYFTKGVEGEIFEEIKKENLKKVVAGGGDGTINQVLNALLKVNPNLELAILPLGTANDFATAARIPFNLEEGINLALDGESFFVDYVKVNQKYFLNVATGGFGAQITISTPPALKNILGGKAYALTGLLKLFSFVPIEGTLWIDGYEVESSAIAVAVCNARQAGGGVILAPEACIDDGKLDIALFTFKNVEAPAHLQPKTNSILSRFSFRKLFRGSKVKFKPKNGLKIMNLDGEPFEAEVFEFEIIPSKLKLTLPSNSPLLGGRV